MDIDLSVLRSLESEKDISMDLAIKAIEDALLVAYHKSGDSAATARVEVDRRTGHVTVWAAETGEDGEVLREYDHTPAGFGRIAATTARQVIVQRLRCFVLHVRKGYRGPSITLSRTHPSLVKRLFSLEVPEIASGVVEIVAIAREAGHRTKIAVTSHQSGVNAKGACIGPMGSRVRNVMTELHGEKIDIVDYSEDSAEFVANALSPARVSRVNIIDADARLAQVIVPDYQLSLAIGKEGQNARLAHKLTGWKIDIHSDNPGGNDTAGRRPAGDHDRGPAGDRGGRPGGDSADPRTGRGTSDAPAR